MLAICEYELGASRSLGSNKLEHWVAVMDGSADEQGEGSSGIQEPIAVEQRDKLQCMKQR